jgi:hypothetical protein
MRTSENMLTTRKKLVLWVFLVCAVVTILVKHLVPLLETAMTPPEAFLERDAAVENIRRLIALAPVLLFFLLVMAVSLSVLAQSLRGEKEHPVSSQEKKAETSSSGGITKYSAWSWIAGFMGILVAISGTIVYVDPYGYYGTDIYETPLLLTRGFKANAYADLPQAPNVVIMGSSSAFSLSPVYIKETLGYSAFNAAVEGGNLADAWLLTKFVTDQHDHALPEVLLIEADPPFATLAETIATRAPLWLIPYMETDIVLETVETRLEGLLDSSQLAEAVFWAQHVRLYGPWEKIYTLRDDGVLEYHANPAGFETRLDTHLKTGYIRGCSQLREDGVRVVNDLVAWAEKHDASVIFYTIPRHPIYYDTFMGDNPDYVRCHSIWLEFMQDLIQKHDNVFLLDFDRLESIGGVDTADGYHDAHHLTNLNGNLWIDAAADTIREAYGVAAQRRSAG